MKIIEKTIRENQEEFMNMVINFVNKKMEDKPKRAPKTICYFNVLGKEYNSKIFTENYKHFLNDVSNIHDYNIFEKSLKSFVNKDINKFSNNAITKSSVVKLNNGGYVSCHSSTQMKMNHIKTICKELNVPVMFIV
jgi:hypothetical protein